jgi:transketolase
VAGVAQHAVVSLEELAETIRAARRRLLQMHYESHVGHVGGNLSALDMLMVLHHVVLEPEDVFILSKGHAAGALYVTLWSLGRLDNHQLRSFHKDGTRLAGHPLPNWLPEIPFATGSLGHGLPLANGVALGKSLQHQPGRVFCLLSDGEMQEGSNWEALIFAKHHPMAPLTILIDANGLQGFGSTEEVSGLHLTADLFRQFGLSADEIDGHDLGAIAAACTADWPGARVVIAHTQKGHGVSFMENRMEWHYLPMTDQEYHQACVEADIS